MLTPAQELHKKDLEAGKKALEIVIKKFGQNSNEFWEVKNRLSKFEISYGQSANMALQEITTTITALVKMDGLHATTSAEIEKNFTARHLYYYQYLTAPYRRERKQEFRDGSKKTKDTGVVDLNADYGGPPPETNEEIMD